MNRTSCSNHRMIWHYCAFINIHMACNPYMISNNNFFVIIDFNSIF